MADVRFIDGQALDPTNFGQFDSATGVWVPITYTGTYGTNGFWLKLDDNSGVTATTLGKDSSGNGNNWTPNNFSVTAGVGNDSLVDSPTWYGTDTGAGGEVRGNYATINPLDNASSLVALTNGNLDGTINNYGASYATIGVSSGKWYWEVKPASGTEWMIGIGKIGGLYDYRVANGYGYFSTNGQKYNSGSGVAYGATYSSADTIGVALDLDAGTLTFYKNGVSQGTAFTGLSGTYFPSLQNPGPTSQGYTYNFGQRPFAYTAPSGFKALCSTNLPTPAIGASASTLASKNFNAVLWTGNGTNPVTVSGVGFQPDLLWAKSRSNAYHHRVADSVRGAGSGKMLYTSLTDVEGNNDAYGYLSAFNSDGFVATAGATNNEAFNTSAATYVGWGWNAGGSTVTNTNGTISSQVRANAAAGISVVTYTANGANGATVGHGLGVAPKMIIVKSRNYGPATNWNVYHQSIGAANTLYLNGTGASTANATAFNSTTPGSSVFTLGTNLELNNNTYNYVAYCFAEVAGFSKFGSYTGNGSADGPFVYCGFRPKFVILKGTSGTLGWIMIDAVRNVYNLANSSLFPHAAAAEDSSGTFPVIDFLSNGFKIRNTAVEANSSSIQFVFAAFAESPFNYSRAR